jgi:hypothetical protein
MATIGLYDIDLWHRGKAFPNLELMQYYNYYNKNDYGLMMKPTDPIGRCNRIIYFKDNPNVDLPKTLDVFGPNKEIYGYGFFKSVDPLPPEVAKVPPSYIAYAPYVNKVSNQSEFSRMQRSSYIRIETNNMADMKPNAQFIYIADRNICYLPDSYDFILENKNKGIFFAHTNFITDLETANKFSRFFPIFKTGIIIDFRYPEDFFFEYYKENVIFGLGKRPDEDTTRYLIRLVKMGLWFKSTGASFRMGYNISLNGEEGKVIEWLRQNPVKTSYMEFRKDDAAAQKFILNCPSELRLLLKQDPKTITRSNLDLKSSL